MGSSSSSLASVTPVVGGGAADALSAEMVAARVKELGTQYEQYAETIASEGIDGAFLAGTAAEDLPGLFKDIGVSSNIHQKKLSLEFEKLKQQVSKGAAEVQLAEGADPPTSAAPAIVMKFRSTTKKFLAFLSHFKEEAGSEARIVQNEMRQLLGPGHPTFLDSDDLFDLRALLEDVKNSQCLVLFQTAGVLTRPWCLLELYTAVTCGVPIVCLNVKGPNDYSYGDALAYLTHIDSELEAANTGAQAFMESNGVDMEELAYLLATTIPNCISVDFNPRGSKNSIEASIKDLIQAIDAATVHERPAESQEAWLAQRPPARRLATSNARKAHGGKAVAPSLQQQGPATIPSAVPELPASFLSRAENVASLKDEVLGGEKERVLAYGMGGAGKTTLACALVREKEVLAQFDRLVWVSIGQEPDIRSLSESVHAQLTGEALDSEAAKTPELVRDRLRDAARGAGRVLLVLDDAWDSRSVKDLDCLDYGDSGGVGSSKLLVTTRIRGLLGEKAAEVNVGSLSEEEALALLLKYAGEEPLLEEGESESEEYSRAVEITALCRQLPLTIAIVGGMVKHNRSGFAADLLSMLKSDLLGTSDQEGLSVEDRVIASSLSMVMQRDDAALIQAVFYSFAIFPEDCEVPKAVLDAFAPTLVRVAAESATKEEPGKTTPVAKATFMVSSAIGTLLNYVLLNGSLSGKSGQGVHAHDIVRDFVIQKHSTQQLHAKQGDAVAVLLSARPPVGFQPMEATQPGSVEHYVALHLHHHMRGALLLTTGEGLVDLPRDEWLTHEDDVVKAACAMAVGHDEMMKMSRAAEAKNDLLLAAKLAFCGYKLGTLGRLSIETKQDEAYRAADLSFKHVRRSKGSKKAEALGLAIDASRMASYGDFGSDRNLAVIHNLDLLMNPPPTCLDKVGAALMSLSCCQKLLVGCAMAATSSKDTYDAHVGKAGAHFFKFCQKYGFLGGHYMKFPHTFTDETYCQAIQDLSKQFEHLRRAKELASLDDHVQRNLPAFYSFQMMSCLPDAYRFDISVLEPVLVESEIVEALSACDPVTDPPRERKLLGMGFSIFLSGGFLGPVVYHHGNISVLDIWIRKATTAYERAGLRSNKNYSAFVQELGFAFGLLPFYCVPLGKESLTWELYKTVGFDKWHDKSNWDIYSNAVLRDNPSRTQLQEELDRGINLFLVAPEGEIDPKDVNAWIDQWTVEELVELFCADFYDLKMFILSALPPIALVYLKLNRDDDAYKTCQLALAPEKKLTKKFTVAYLHMIMGKISGRRGNFDVADKQYTSALKAAEQSGLPMFELLAARDWKKHALEPAGRPTDNADAAINAACTKMNKKRERFASLLLL